MKAMFRHGGNGSSPPLLLLFALSSLGYAISTHHSIQGLRGLPRHLVQGQQPNPCSVDGTPDGPMYMTAINKCPNDEFYVSFGPSGADGTPIPAGAQYDWKGAFLSVRDDLDGGYYPRPIILLRATDNKIVAPKGVKADGTFYDISNTKQRMCQLFEEVDGKIVGFAPFRGSMDADRVYRDDFASQEFLNSMPQGGIPCEQYRDDGNGIGKGVKVTVGKVVDMYWPSSCLYAIDDCTT